MDMTKASYLQSGGGNWRRAVAVATIGWVCCGYDAASAAQREGAGMSDTTWMLGAETLDAIIKGVSWQVWRRSIVRSADRLTCSRSAGCGTLRRQDKGAGVPRP